MKKAVLKVTFFLAKFEKCEITGLPNHTVTLYIRTETRVAVCYIMQFLKIIEKP